MPHYPRHYIAPFRRRHVARRQKACRSRRCHTTTMSPALLHRHIASPRQAAARRRRWSHVASPMCHLLDFTMPRRCWTSAQKRAERRDSEEPQDSADRDAGWPDVALKLCYRYPKQEFEMAAFQEFPLALSFLRASTLSPTLRLHITPFSRPAFFRGGYSFDHGLATAMHARSRIRHAIMPPQGPARKLAAHFRRAIIIDAARNRPTMSLSLTLLMRDMPQGRWPLQKICRSARSPASVCRPAGQKSAKLRRWAPMRYMPSALKMIPDYAD